MNFDPSTIMNLVGQLGGNHQQAAQQMQGMDQIDPEQHSGLLNQFGVDPQQLMNGGYQQHLDAQQQPGFQGYQQGQNYSNQQPGFSGGEQGGYQQEQNAGFGGQQGGYQQEQNAGFGGQQGGYQQEQDPAFGGDQGGYDQPGQNY